MKTYEPQFEQGNKWVPVVFSSVRTECYTIGDAYIRACMVSLRDKVTTRVIEHGEHASIVRLEITVPSGEDAVL